MSYGPQLPLHLQKQRVQANEDPQEDPLNRTEDDGSDDDTGLYEPKLPPGLSRTSRENTASNIAPKTRLPEGFPCSTSPVQGMTKPNSEHDSDDDGDDVIGPMLPTSEKTCRQLQISKQLEERAQKLKYRNDDCDIKEAVPQKRESWMLELPPEKAKNFGLGPRQFSRSLAPKTQQDRSWADTPEMKAKRAAAAAEGGAIKGKFIQIFSPPSMKCGAILSLLGNTPKCTHLNSFLCFR